MIRAVSALYASGGEDPPASYSVAAATRRNARL